MKTTMKLGLVGAFAATVAAVGARDARAQSCGMGNIDWYANERANVARAEQLLQNGQPQDAAWLIQQTWPRMHEAVPVASSLPQIAEGVRVMALAAVRSDGDVRTGLGWASRTPLERSQNAAWGVARLRMLVAANADSDAAKTDLGEALALAPSTEDEGRAILEGLAARGAIATPEGYAALARVRTASGDAQGAEVASAECVRRAVNAQVQCGAPAAAEPVVAASR